MRKINKSLLKRKPKGWRDGSVVRAPVALAEDLVKFPTPSCLTTSSTSGRKMPTLTTLITVMHIVHMHTYLHSGKTFIHINEKNLKKNYF